MTPTEACIQAVGYNHGIDPEDIVGPDKNQRLTYYRRVAAHVAHVSFDEAPDEIARHFRRNVSWVFAALARMADEIRESLIVARDIEDTRRRARAILERHGVETAKDSAAVSLLNDRQTEEARRLRKQGWSILGLAKRYGIPPAAVAPVIGETWGART